MKKLLSVAVVCCFLFASCNSFLKPYKIPKMQDSLMSQEHHDAVFSFIPVDDSMTFKSPFQLKGEKVLFLNFEDIPPLEFFDQDSSFPLSIQGYGYEIEDKTKYTYDIRAIQLAHPEFQKDRYQVPQWRLPIALVDQYYLHFMHTEERSTEIWLSSMDMSQFIFVDTADVLTEVAYYESMRMSFGQKNYYVYIDDGHLAYRKKDDIVLLNIFDFLKTRELDPIILPGAGKNLYKPFSGDLHPFFNLSGDLRYLCLQVATDKKETIVYVIDKDMRTLVNTLLLEEIDYFNHHRIFFSEEASIVFSSNLSDNTIKIYPFEASKPQVIDLSKYDQEGYDFLYSLVYASHNEQGWLFCLLSAAFQTGTKDTFYTLQLNHDFELDQIRRHRWIDSDKYEHQYFSYSALHKTWNTISRLKDTDTFYLIENSLIDISNDSKMNIYPLQLPLNPGKEKLQVSFYGLSDKVFALFNIKNETAYGTVLLYELIKN